MAKEIEEKKKLSYEELENVCHQLSDQSQTLYRKLQEANLSNMFKRLDYLFAVLENKEIFAKDYSDFFNGCVKEIVDYMTIPGEPIEPTAEESGTAKAS